VLQHHDVGEITAGAPGESAGREYPMLSVVEGTPGAQRVYDLYSTLVNNRVVFVGTPIDKAAATLVTAELLYLYQPDDPEQDIEIHVNSAGGDVDARLVIFDAMHLVRPWLATTCVGAAVGVASLVVAGGARGYRATLANVRLMMHQPSTVLEGVAADIDVRAREIIRRSARLVELLTNDTPHPVERVARDLNRDFWLSAEEAHSYGLVDRFLRCQSNTASGRLGTQGIGRT
jgi:ATP-dependent Clp protease protease subunit